MKRDTRAWDRIDAAYAFALRLYPRAFRERWGEPMQQAFRDRCREVARGERGITALLAESCTDLARSLASEHGHSMEETPMKFAAIALAVVLSATHLGNVELRGADLRFALGSLLMVAPAVLFLLSVARPGWPVRLAALVFNGLMPALFVLTLVQGKLPPLSLMLDNPLPSVLIVGLFLVSPVLNLAVILRTPRHVMPLAA
jgi:hypothetical protein